MNIKYLYLMFAIALLIGGSIGFGEPIQKLITVQGRLTDANDDPLSGSYTFLFKIYDKQESGTSIWSETQTLTLDIGIFSANLGSVNPVDLPFADQYWLEINVNGETLSPRTKLTRSGYTYSANRLLPTSYPVNVNTGELIAGKFETTSTSPNAYGVYGKGYYYGVKGEGSSYGIFGIALTTGGNGVYGIGANGNGVYGSGRTGVYGEGDIGVYGTGATGIYGKVDRIGGNGIYGEAPITGGNGIYGKGRTGIYGEGYYYGIYATGETGISARGNSMGIDARGTEYGIYAYSQNYGVYGNGKYGIYGEGSTYGIYGYSQDNYGGYFNGKVGVTKNLVAGGSIYKKAVQAVIGGIEYKSNNCPGAMTCTVSCSSGKNVIGGGCSSANAIITSRPEPTPPSQGNAWSCTIGSGDTVTAYAICADIS